MASLTKWLVLGTAGAALTLASCNKKLNNEIDQILSGDPKKKSTTSTNKAAAPAPNASSTTGAAAAASPADNVPLSAAAENIKALVIAGRYDQAIAAGAGNNDPWVRYFVGIGHYGKMLSPERYSVAVRLESRNQAVAILKEVAGGTRDESLKARALLWYGQALYLMFEGLAENQEALKSFETIQTSFKDSDVYNDSLLFSARTWYKIGIYVKALEYYKRLTTESFRENLIYDPEGQRVVDVRTAGNVGIQRVIAISIAGERDRAARAAAASQSTPAPAPKESSSSSSSSSTSTGSSSSSTSASTGSGSSTSTSASSSSSTGSSSSSSSNAGTTSSTGSTSGSSSTSNASTGTNGGN